MSDLQIVGMEGGDNRKQELVKSAGGEVEECKGLGNEPGRGGGWEADTFLRKDSITG